MKFRRFILPLIVFVGVWIIHYLWLFYFPSNDAAQNQWLSLDSVKSPWERYLESKDYFLSYSYSLSLAFAAICFRRYSERRYCTVGIASIGLPGALSIGGCFLIGCCGSPMLAVYISLFGVRFLPFAKPAIAALTTLSLTGAWLWMTRSKAQVIFATVESCDCNEPRGKS